MKRSVVRATGALALALGALLSFKGLAASEFDSNVAKSFPVEPGSKLVVAVDRGNLTVTTGHHDQVTVQVFRRVNTTSQAKADQIFADHDVTFNQDGDTVTVSAKAKRESVLWSGRNVPNLEVRYQISIPRKFGVNLRTSGGDVQLGPELEGDAAARTSSGTIHLQTVTGSVQANNSGGDILLDEVGGATTAQTSSGTVKLEKAMGTVEAKNSGGDIQITSAGAAVLARTSSGTIKLGTARGKVDARNSGGDISIQEAGEAVFVSTSSGSIYVKEAQGNVEAKDSGGDIVIGESGGEVVVQTSSGKIQLGKVAGKLKAKNSGGNIEVARAFGPVQAKTSSGAIRVSMIGQPEQDSRLEVSGGEIQVSLTEKAALDLDARASGGRVITEMPVTLTVQGEQDHERLQGKINGGGPTLTLRTSSGSIHLKKTKAAEL